MQFNVLFDDGDRYGGKYVATRSFEDRTVISSGEDPIKVYNEAKERGADDPVIVYIPEKDMVQIY